MKRLLLIAPLALATLPAHAQSSRSVTVDRPNYEGTRTVARDGQGSISRDTDVTRKSDGATASRDYDRTATGSGWTASGSATGFEGRTRSFDASHSRGNGSAATNATATGPNGGSVHYAGSSARTGNGYVRSQDVTTGSGRSLLSRDVAVSRGGGQVSRSVNSARAAGYHPRARAARRRR
jgi:hypothetical protein